MTPWPLFRETFLPSTSPFRSIRTVQRVPRVGDRIAAREARARKGAKRARVMHLRCCGLTPDELAGVSGWQDVSDV